MRTFLTPARRASDHLTRARATSAARRIGAALLAALVVACDGRAPSDPEAPPATPRGPSTVAPPPQPVVLRSHIFVAAADGTGERRFVEGSTPTWAPDGRWIAFEYRGAVHIADVDGEATMRLAVGRSPAWSPDARRIAFVTEEGIASIGVDGTDLRTILPLRSPQLPTYRLGVDMYAPKWSPDAQRIAFTLADLDDYLPSTVYVMRADGSDVHPLTGGANHVSRWAESSPAWAPDGRTIALWTYDKGIAVVDAGGGGELTPIAGAGFPSGLDWSPDGRTLLISTCCAGSASDILLWSADGGARMLIADASRGDWSPDGTRIVFERAVPIP